MRPLALAIRGAGRILNDEARVALRTLRRLDLKMAEDDNQNDQDSGVALQEARPKTKKPPLYKVVMLNDDYTPMEFVVHVLEQFFSVDRPTATRIMLEVHTRGKGVCGLFTHEIAETKVSQVNQYARENQHPLLCTLELA